MRDEMRSIVENKTWELVPVPENNVKVIQGKWVYRTKSNSDGQIIKYKSRWVVRGFQQEEGFNFTETFACVVKPMSYKILFSIAASRNLEVEQMDVKTAFLNSPIFEDVSVEQPHGFEVDSPADEVKVKNGILQPHTDKNQNTDAYPRNKTLDTKLVCKLQKALYGLKQAPRAWYETLSARMEACKLGSTSK